MERDDKHIDPQILTGKYLAGEASKEEISMLEKWVLESESNKNLFNEYKRVWNLANYGNLSREINVDKEWETLVSRLDEKKTVAAIPLFKRYFAVAATIIVLITTGLVLYFLLSGQGKEQFVAENSVSVARLADGTEVTLDHNSKIVFYKNKKGIRKVMLEGDAFFKVKKDPSKPFVIETQNTEIKVLGTSFYVNSHNDRPVVEVIVNTGKVSFSAGKNNRLILVAGEKGIFDKHTGKLVKTNNTDPNYLAWKTKHLEFHNNRMGYVLEQIGKAYHTDFKIENKAVENCRVTATFDKQSLNAVLKILEETVDMKFVKQKDFFIVKGEGCEK